MAPRTAMMMWTVGCQPAAAPTPRPMAGASTDPVYLGAVAQLEDAAVYDASYQPIRYPGGDVPKDRGACADVVVRALRHAGLDLQKAIHEDAARHRYPRIGTRRDRNIDHRRVANQVVYLKRHGKALANDRDWRAGDIVAWVLPNGRDHIGIVSEHKGRSGNLAVIHNIGRVSEDDVLYAWQVVGHYRASLRTDR
ncbi:MAG: DUF1287 domain-containing protein [Fimbriimonadaceae bacterium]|nr:DUF1287 domain-containing protein [Fimbriimonadaceae bacterium]QYK55360.1 MAG: DUF1287 domain-containing protein [Fimbriimonadaceae bacterium]